MKFLLFLKSPKVLFVPLAAASLFGSYYAYNHYFSQTLEKAVLDTITRPYEFKNSSSPETVDTEISRNKEYKNIKPFNGLPSVTIFYTKKEEEKLENSVSAVYDTQKNSFSNTSITKKQYGAWCDGLFFGHLNDSDEYKVWKEKCWNNGSSTTAREHINSWLKVKYPKGLYEKTGVFSGWNPDDFPHSPSTSNAPVKCGELFGDNGSSSEKTGYQQCNVVFPPAPIKSPQSRQ